MIRHRAAVNLTSLAKFLIYFKRRPVTTTGIILLSLLFVLAIFAPVIVSSDPGLVDPTHSKLAPTFLHLLGTDFAGRDVFSRLLHSLRLAYLSGLLAVFITAGLGITLGLWAGYYGRWIDSWIVWLMDLWLALPELLFILVLITVLGRDIWQVLIAIGLAGIPSFTRFVRLLTIHEKSQSYVEAAHVIGASPQRIVFTHILRNLWPALVTRLAIRFGYAILAASTLSFIGIGVQPAIPELGSLLDEGWKNMSHAWWLTAGPLVVLWLTMLGANLISDGITEQS